MPARESCLTKEQTQKAWDMEFSGDTRLKAAIKYNVSIRTLERCYKRYGFGSPTQARVKCRDFNKKL